MNDEDIETNKYPYTCSHCDCKAGQKSSLKKHVEVICVLNCIQCDYKSTTKDCVKKHGDAIHEGVF